MTTIKNKKGMAFIELTIVMVIILIFIMTAYSFLNGISSMRSTIYLNYKGDHIKTIDNFNDKQNITNYISSSGDYYNYYFLYTVKDNLVSLYDMRENSEKIKKLEEDYKKYKKNMFFYLNYTSQVSNNVDKSAYLNGFRNMISKYLENKLNPGVSNIIFVNLNEIDSYCINGDIYDIVSKKPDIDQNTLRILDRNIECLREEHFGLNKDIEEDDNSLIIYYKFKKEKNAQKGRKLVFLSDNGKIKRDKRISTYIELLSVLNVYGTMQPQNVVDNLLPLEPEKVKPEVILMELANRNTKENEKPIKYTKPIEKVKQDIKEKEKAIKPKSYTLEDIKKDFGYNIIIKYITKHDIINCKLATKKMTKQGYIITNMADLSVDDYTKQYNDFKNNKENLTAIENYKNCLVKSKVKDKELKKADLIVFHAKNRFIMIDNKPNQVIDYIINNNSGLTTTQIFTNFIDRTNNRDIIDENYYVNKLYKEYLEYIKLISFYKIKANYPNVGNLKEFLSDFKSNPEKYNKLDNKIINSINTLLSNIEKFNNTEKLDIGIDEILTPNKYTAYNYEKKVNLFSFGYTLIKDGLIAILILITATFFISLYYKKDNK